MPHDPFFEYFSFICLRNAEAWMPHFFSSSISLPVRCQSSSCSAMLLDVDLSAELPSIKCPVLVIGGEFDRGRPPSRVEPIAKAIPGAKFKVLRTGHYAGWQTPELVATEIGAFLDGVGA